MKTIFASLALFAAGAFAQSTFTISTPSNVVECQPTLLNWSGGTAPYFLSILPGATPTGAALENLPQVNSTSITWICNIASGTSIGFTLRDSTGLVAQSAPVTINPGSSTSCVNITSVIPGPTSSGSGATTAAGGGGATPPGISTAPTTTSAGSSTSTGTSKSGASANVAQFGTAGIVGAAVAALFL